MPKNFISKTLIMCNNIKNARILKTSNVIVSQISKNLNNTFRNIHTKVKNIVGTVKHSNDNNYLKISK